MSISLSQSNLLVIQSEAGSHARRLLRGLHLPPHDLADLRQELLADFLRRFRAFDVSRGSIGAFANVVMTNEGHRLARRHLAYRKVFGTPSSFVDNSLPGAGQSPIETTADTGGNGMMMGHYPNSFGAVEQRLDVERMLGALSEKDAELCRRLLHYSATECSQDCATSRATVYRHLARIRALLINNGFGQCDTFSMRRVEILMDCFPRRLPVPNDGLSSRDFATWLETAQPGAMFVYHQGSLVLSTNADGVLLPHAERQKLARLAQLAWSAAQQGRVHLLQRREGDACFTYLAVARPRLLQS